MSNNKNKTKSFYYPINVKASKAYNNTSKMTPKKKKTRNWIVKFPTVMELYYGNKYDWTSGTSLL